MPRRLPFLVLILFFAGMMTVAGDVFYSSRAQFTAPSQNTSTASDERYIRLYSVDSPANLLIEVELWLGVLLCVALLLKSLWRKKAGLSGKRRKLWSWGIAGLAFILFVHACAQHETLGRPILAVGLSMPGSLLTRFVNLETSWSLRRAVEPSIWILAIAIFSCSYICVAAFARTLAVISGITCLVVLGGESILSIPAVQDVFAGSDTLSITGRVVHFLLTEICLLALIYGLNIESQGFSKAQLSENVVEFPTAERVKNLCVLLGIATGVFALSLVGYRELFLSHKRLLVGAHYYSWFPENWASGYASKEFRPPVEPQLGEYSSYNSDVFLQHVTWAKEAGVDFFIFDWWPERKDVRGRVRDSVRSKEGIFDEFKFAIQYETLDLKSTERTRFSDEDENVLIVTKERVQRLKKHWEFLAEHYMKHPSYLRINNKPVLFVYAARHLVGDVAGAIREAKWYVKRTTGVELFLVGDEVFFNVLSISKQGKIYLKEPLEPEWDRLIAFDALTCYNPYDSFKPEHAGNEGAERFVEDVEALYGRYRAVAATAGQVFIPGVIPGYNDRGVRLEANHYVIPRVIGEQPESSLFKQGLKRLALPFLDQDRPILAITSWNEWNEGTQIEPSKVSAVTNEDSSGDFGLFSNHQFHHGYGCEHLEELAEVLRAWKIKYSWAGNRKNTLYP